MTNISTEYARAFATTHGAAVLRHLRAITLERTLGPNASDGDLRWHAAQCALVRQIENHITTGQSQ